MEKFQLSLLFKIIGIGSASGLVYHDEKLYIISDSSDYLYEYVIKNEKLNKIALIENAEEQVAKSEKLDFESIIIKGNELVVLGSGSTENRNWSFRYNINSKKVAERDFTPIYKMIKSQLDIKDNELNIEGFIISEDNSNMYFFQRGNGINTKNGIIYGDEKSEYGKFKFAPLELPKIKNVPATFTDAVLVDKTIYFLASAEDTASTYLDGEVLGSIIGTIDLKTMKVENTIQISDKHKFEGLALYGKTDVTIEFLLCEDTDSEKTESDIYKLVINRTQ